MLKLIQIAKGNMVNTAIVEGEKSFSYESLLSTSEKVASVLLGEEKDLREKRIAFLVPPGFDYVKIQWGIWRAGGIAVPLCTLHPLPSLTYVLEDTEADTLILSPEFEEMLWDWAKENEIRCLSLKDLGQEGSQNLPDVSLERRAMILYTSGTTNLPKGVVTTHANIEAQIQTLIDAWEWSEKDHILCTLPLHHVHGIINVVSCALWAGAKVEFIRSFDATEVFRLFLKGEINLYMAVPTIYYKLIAYWEKLDKVEQSEISKALASFRLMVSGSAALPISVLEKWRAISGHTLLER
ncbi:MAG: AMP-binding protein, partial [Bacteroidota bacterium]